MSPSGAAGNSCPASTVPNPCRSSTRTTPTVPAPPSVHRRIAAPTSRCSDADAGGVTTGTDVTQSRVAAPGGSRSQAPPHGSPPAGRGPSGRRLGRRGGVGGDPLPGEQPDRGQQCDGERRGAHREAGGDRVRRGLDVPSLGALASAAAWAPAPWVPRCSTPSPTAPTTATPSVPPSCLTVCSTPEA